MGLPWFISLQILHSDISLKDFTRRFNPLILGIYPFLKQTHLTKKHCEEYVCSSYLFIYIYIYMHARQMMSSRWHQLTSFFSSTPRKLRVKAKRHAISFFVVKNILGAGEPGQHNKKRLKASTKCLRKIEKKQHAPSNSDNQKVRQEYHISFQCPKKTSNAMVPYQYEYIFLYDLKQGKYLGYIIGWWFQPL